MKSSPWRRVDFLHVLLILFFLPSTSLSQSANRQKVNLASLFRKPGDEAKPWVFWYWMNAAVTEEGIKADLTAMRSSGIGGAYLMPIYGVQNPPLISPPAQQLSPQFWKLVKYALNESDSLGIKIAVHASDGFALAGGPWITPELSMQKITSADTAIAGGRLYQGYLPRPATMENYYQDIAVYAYPTPAATSASTYLIQPRVTTSTGEDASFLIKNRNHKEFKSKNQCWIQYEFKKPFTCRTIRIKSMGYNYQANRLLIQSSDDGINYRETCRLEPPRSGWQDDTYVTHAVPEITAKYFRFVYDKTGSEPGAEDLDDAKWIPEIKLTELMLSAQPRIDGFEGKSGEVWRIGKLTSEKQIKDTDCIPLNEVINLTDKMTADGRLNWNAPEGKWTILRIGHTSTGSTNATGGGAKGLECDKFNPMAVELQFNSWFGEVLKQAGPELASRVIRILHVDSWECGSQNWSVVFKTEFMKRRGYDPSPYLPVMAGLPLQSVDISERFLFDVRQTIADLVADNFYVTLSKLAHSHGVKLSAECVAPTMVSDGMLHYKESDIPMGEFWLRSPTNDKPNDIADAVSGAHIYGKKIIQSEAFTEIRQAWDEYPAMLKTLQDRNYALGINRLVYHVFTHNPWMDRKPGMTLGGIGLFFQRDQTWWKPGKAWVDYARRCQTLLQQGVPVIDIAVFTGEEAPRRAILPERLVPILPGIFGKDRILSEKERLDNHGEPLKEMPEKIFSSANFAYPENWTDPLHGYAYDSFNKDALINLAKVKKGKIILPGGSEYSALIIPGAYAMSPDSLSMTPETSKKLLSLVQDGATLIVARKPVRSPSLSEYPKADQDVNSSIEKLYNGSVRKMTWKIGKGKVFIAPFIDTNFHSLGLTKDLIAINHDKTPAAGIAWTHRTDRNFDIYFISNQLDSGRIVNLSLRVSKYIPELWDPVTGEISTAREWKIFKKRMDLPVYLPNNGSLFIVMKKRAGKITGHKGYNWPRLKTVQNVSGVWEIAFDNNSGSLSNKCTATSLTDWSKSPDERVKYYSGTATYSNTFIWRKINSCHTFLDLGEIANIAQVSVNGIDCGVAWTKPYRLDITNAVKRGNNKLEIQITNTWRNRLVGDAKLTEKERSTFTTARGYGGLPLLKAGLLGPVTLKVKTN